MTTTTNYGTWRNHVGNQNAHETVANCLSGAPQEWREAMEAAGADKAIAAEIYEIVDAALPEGVWRSGEEFYGPVDGDRDLGFLREVVDGIDMKELVGKYDVDRQTETAPEPYVYNRQAALDLDSVKSKILTRVKNAEAALAALPPNSKSHAAKHYRSYIASAPKRIADLDRLIAIVEATRQA